MPSSNSGTPSSANTVDARTTPVSPRLWNPGAAAGWSLVFSPIFGALVQARNWEELGEQDRAGKSKSWALGSLAFLVALALLPVFSSNEKVVDGLTRLLTVALLVTWYYANGKYQQTYVLARFGKTYQKRGWTKPLLLAVAAIVAFMVVMALVGLVIGAATGAV